MSSFIVRREKEDNLYNRLQERSIEMLQQLSGKVWSDFNPHDPGMTILDALNYALLELDYKFDFPFGEYLAGEKDDRLDMRRFGVPSPEDFFSDSVVTREDYEVLITGNVRGVKHCRAAIDERGLYAITLDIVDGANKHDIRAEVKKLYHANRNLCENLGSIAFGKINRKTEARRSERPAIRQDKRDVSSAGMAAGNYRSIQTDFPDCYGINECGTPVGATEEHHARINQLKGYLLIFDHLTEYASSQADVSGLFELSAGTPRYKLPSINIPDIGKLIDRSRIASAAMEKDHFREKQKSRYLDMLDVIHGEDTSTLFIHSAKDLSEINRMRAELIAIMPHLHAGRCRSFDLSDENPGSVSGAKRFISAMTGFPLSDEKPLTNVFSRHSLKLVHDNHFFGHRGRMPNMEFVFQEAEANWSPHDMEPVPLAEVVYNDRAIDELRKRINLLWDGIIFESFLIYGSYAEHYRAVHTNEREGYMLVFRHPQAHRWINLGAFHSKAELTDTANVLWRFIARLAGECSSFYLLEHILLDDGGNEPADRDESNTLSVIVPNWMQRTYDPQQYESLIAERLPAHLDVRFLWLHADKLYVFEHLYFMWKQALANRNRRLAAHCAFEIRRFLSYNTNAPGV